MDMTTVFGVKEAAERARNRKGSTGVTVHYIRAEIKRGNLKAELIENPVVGKPYFLINEEDFAAWEAKREKKS
jgi:hypothetical protein